MTHTTHLQLCDASFVNINNVVFYQMNRFLDRKYTPKIQL
jgi:hypothetical protein